MSMFLRTPSQLESSSDPESLGIQLLCSSGCDGKVLLAEAEALGVLVWWGCLGIADILATGENSALSTGNPKPISMLVHRKAGSDVDMLGTRLLLCKCLLVEWRSCRDLWGDNSSSLSWNSREPSDALSLSITDDSAWPCFRLYTCFAPSLQRMQSMYSSGSLSILLSLDMSSSFCVASSPLYLRPFGMLISLKWNKNVKVAWGVVWLSVESSSRNEKPFGYSSFFITFLRFNHMRYGQPILGKLWEYLTNLDQWRKAVFEKNIRKTQVWYVQ